MTWGARLPGIYMAVYDTYIYNYQIYSNTPHSHSGSTANDETGEEAKNSSQRTNSLDGLVLKTLALGSKPNTRAFGWDVIS